jgi:hypothetical protein
MNGAEQIFNEVTVLQAHQVFLNDYELLNEDVLSLEVSWSFNRFFVNGTLSIKDSFSITELDLFNGETTLKIYSKDFYNEIFSKTFMVTNVNVEEYNKRHRALNISFVDTAYFKLLNTYISKGFNDTVPNAVSAYFADVGVDDALAADDVTKEVQGGEVQAFVVPQDRSAYQFFTEDLQRYGVRFWQDRKKVHIKDIQLNTLPEMTDGDYSNNTDNDKYGFKIHDYKVQYNNTVALAAAAPISVNYTFDPATKSMNTDTLNFEDIFDTIKLNDKPMAEMALQQTNGQKFDMSEHLSVEAQRIRLEDMFSENQSLEIVVPGNYKYNKVGQIVNVDLKGNPTINETSLEGDVLHSGKYYVKEMTDRYFGDKLIQKLKLTRVDSQKPRKR